MKKRVIFLLVIFLSSTLFAGFSGPRVDMKVTNANEVESLGDDTEVLLEGYLINQVGNEKYTFKDDSGKIIVEIDQKDFRNLTITPQDKVKLYGEVDKELMEDTKVDVDYVEIVK